VEADKLRDLTRILGSMHAGVYVCDLERRIRYWNDAAARITGWSRDRVIGTSCHDDLLCHEDKDGNLLCKETTCPLHRAMVTGRPSTAPVLLFAQAPDGSRRAVEVCVAPVVDDDGTVIGGVESFTDVREVYADLVRAQRLQAATFRIDLPRGGPLAGEAYCASVGIVGGDFYVVEQLEDGACAFLVADVMGHGLAAALHTMHLHSQWVECRAYRRDPAELARHLNSRLCELMAPGGGFAAGVAGLVRPDRYAADMVGLGGPRPVVADPAGRLTSVECPGPPLGMFPDSRFASVEVELPPGSRLLLATDGATEIPGATGERIGAAGFLNVLSELGYGRQPVPLRSIAGALLDASQCIRFPDDLCLVEISVLR
jgi:PAS domain S-box-containing protein